MRLHGDERGFVGSSFFRLAIFLLLLGVASIDTIAIVFAKVQSQSYAEAGATYGAVGWRDGRTVEAARASAEGRIREEDPLAVLESIDVRPDGSVRVVVLKRASTLLAHRFGFTRELTLARGRAVGRPPPA